MSEEENEAIQKLNIYKEKITFELYPTFNFEEEKALGLVLNLIEKQNNRLEQLEKENEFWKEYKEKLDKLDTKDFIFKHELENYIPKSVIREKIEELRYKRDKTEITYYLDAQIDMLKELLGGSNE